MKRLQGMGSMEGVNSTASPGARVGRWSTSILPCLHPEKPPPFQVKESSPSSSKKLEGGSSSLCLSHHELSKHQVKQQLSRVKVQKASCWCFSARSWQPAKACLGEKLTAR